MVLTCESNIIDDYLPELGIVDFNHPLIRNKVNDLFLAEFNELDKVRIAYEFVRDHISHSFDIDSSRITCKASEVLQYKEGICYAKSNLLAAILRSINIPTGFCYQKLTKGDTPDTGYCIHALNAVYIKELGRWIRLDARGNKEGVHAEFSIAEEKLAFPIREEYEELDYPVIYTKPNDKTINALIKSANAQILFQNLPVEL